MRAEQIESWAFGRTEAAEIVVITEGQLGNWLTRYRLFPEKMRGTGHPVSFDLPNLMRLGAMKELVALGLEPQKAAEALRPYGSPYGALIHNSAGDHGSFPGIFSLIKNKDGRWIGADSSEAITAIQIRAWPLFDRIFPRAAKRMVAAPGLWPVAEVRQAVADFTEKIEALRASKWAEVRNA